jgi:WD40 repeat protein
VFFTARDCWAVAFGHAHTGSDRMVAAGYDNGDVKMFDLRRMGLHWETQLPNGVCGLSFDRKDINMNKLLATCLEGRIHMWDLRTLHSKQGFSGLSHKVEKGQTIWGGKFLPQNREVFLTQGGSGSLGLYKYTYPEKRTKILDDDSEIGVIGKIEKLQESAVGDQPISGFDWSPDKAGLGVCTAFDQKIRLVIVTKINTI